MTKAPLLIRATLSGKKLEKAAINYLFAPAHFCVKHSHASLFLYVLNRRQCFKY